MYQTKFGPLESLKVDVFVVVDSEGVVGPFQTVDTAYYFKNCLNDGQGRVARETWTGLKALKALEHFDELAQKARK